VRPVRWFGARRLPARSARQRSRHDGRWPRPNCGANGWQSTSGSTSSTSIRPASNGCCCRASRSRRRPAAWLRSGAGWPPSSRAWRPATTTTCSPTCGRLTTSHPPTAMLHAADVVLLLVRPELPSISAARRRAPYVAARARRTRQRLRHARPRRRRPGHLLARRDREAAGHTGGRRPSGGRPQRPGAHPRRHRAARVAAAQAHPDSRGEPAIDRGPTAGAPGSDGRPGGFSVSDDRDVNGSTIASYPSGLYRNVPHYELTQRPAEFADDVYDDAEFIDDQYVDDQYVDDQFVDADPTMMIRHPAAPVSPGMPPLRGGAHRSALDPTMFDAPAFRNASLPGGGLDGTPHGPTSILPVQPGQPGAPATADAVGTAAAQTALVEPDRGSAAGGPRRLRSRTDPARAGRRGADPLAAHRARRDPGRDRPPARGDRRRGGGPLRRHDAPVAAPR